MTEETVLVEVASILNSLCYLTNENVSHPINVTLISATRGRKSDNTHTHTHTHTRTCPSRPASAGPLTPRALGSPPLAPRSLGGCVWGDAQPAFSTAPTPTAPAPTWKLCSCLANVGHSKCKSG